MPYVPDQESWLALSLVPEVGGQTLRRLLIAFGTPDAVLGKHRSELEKVIPARQAAADRRDDRLVEPRHASPGHAGGRGLSQAAAGNR